MSTSDRRTPDATLDLRGLSCPGPLLGAKQLIDQLQLGQVLLLLSDCPGTQGDLFSWVKYTDNEILRTEPAAGGGSAYTIRKGKSRRPQAQLVLDMRGITCPGPVVEAKKLIDGMQPGEVLRLISNCPGIRDDIAGWVRATHLELLETVEVAAGEYEFFIRRPASR